MKKAFIILFLFSTLHNVAQEFQFSQYYSTSLYLNPGFGGVYNHTSIHMNHKRQIQNKGFINELTQVSLILPLKPRGDIDLSIGGIGIMAFTQNNGFYKRNSAFLNYAYNLKLGLLNSYLVTIGLQIGYDIQKSNLSQLLWPSQYNQFIGGDDTFPSSVSEFDTQIQNLLVNVGVMYYYNPQRNFLLYQYSGFVGLSATNLNRPNLSFAMDNKSPAPILLKYNGGIEFKLNKFFVTPSLLLFQLSKNYQFNIGLNLKWASQATKFTTNGPQLLFGTWYRLRDAFIFMGGIKLNQFTVRASYDLNTKLFAPETNVNYNQTSMEISIQYSFFNGVSSNKSSNPLF